MPEPPHISKIDYVRRRAQSKQSLGITGEDQTSTTRNADELRGVGDEIALRSSISSGMEGLGVADFQLDTARNGGGEGRILEVRFPAKGQVERDDVDIEGGAGEGETAVGGWTRGDEVVG